MTHLDPDAVARADAELRTALGPRLDGLTDAVIANVARQVYLAGQREALAQCVEALRLTREYVGEDMLPALPGWSWFDATERANAILGAASSVQATEGENDG